MVLLALCLPAATAAAGSAELDVRGWLDRPGVKVLAVEFYATWCKPCMEAVPRWKALHDKYRDDGLRLVVVNTLDAGGACRAVPWTPDKTVCDIEGTVGKSFGLGGNLPAAFIWTWQGNLLVRKGHIEVAETEIARYLKQSPRVLIETRGLNGRADDELAAQVRNEVVMSGKLQVVASQSERSRLAKLRKESHRAAGRQDQRCKLGAELSANSLLDARLVGSKDNAKLSIALHSAESGCLLASTWVAWSRKRSAQAVREAVAALINVLRRPPEHPRGGGWDRPVASKRTLPVKEGRIGGESGEDWDPSGGRGSSAIVRFESTPKGAIVLVDGKLMCKSTPCQKALEPGRYNVDMQLDEHVPHKEIVQIDKGVTLSFDLKPDFATLDVVTVPPGVAVRIDGKQVSGSGLSGRRVSAGPHELVIEGRCFYRTGERIVVKRGERRQVKLSPKPKPSAIRVSVKDSAGNELPARVFIDDEVQGQTAPGIFKLPVCSRSLRLTHQGMREVTRQLSLQEKQLTQVQATMQAAAAPRAVAARTRAAAATGASPAAAGGGQRSPAWRKAMATVDRLVMFMDRSADRIARQGPGAHTQAQNRKLLKRLKKLGKVFKALKGRLPPGEKAAFDDAAKARFQPAMERYMKAVTAAGR